MITETAQDNISVHWLYNVKGYTFTQAAHAINKTPSHVRRVVRGGRKHKPTVDALLALPDKELTDLRIDKKQGNKQ